MTSPHSTTLVDLDGDCISDLFMTVQDKHTGEQFYEIYLRRERAASLAVEGEGTNKADKNGLKGLNSYCLVTREPLPSGSRNLFSFTDVDRDGAIDMMYLSKEGSDDPLNLFIHYNRLQHGRKQYDNPKHNVVFGMKDICESTTRPINLIKDIFLSRSVVSDLKETSLIMKL